MLFLVYCAVLCFPSYPILYCLVVLCRVFRFSSGSFDIRELVLTGTWMCGLFYFVT
jgi:hypothetical protein